MVSLAKQLKKKEQKKLKTQVANRKSREIKGLRSALDIEANSHAKILEDVKKVHAQELNEVQNENDKLKKAIDDLKSDLNVRRKREGCLKSEIRQIEKKNNFMFNFFSFCWNLTVGCVPRMTIPSQNSLSLNVGPFLAFSLLLKTAEIRLFDKMGENGWLNKCGGPGVFHKGRSAADLMYFWYPKRKDKGQTWFVFKNLKELQTNFRFWDACYDSTSTKLDKKGTTFNKNDLLTFLEKHGYTDKKLLVFFPCFQPTVTENDTRLPYSHKT